MARSRFTILATLAFSALALGVAAREIVLEDYPVNYGIRAKPNILLSVDDSSSMDVELSVVGTREGFGYWNPTEQSFVVNGVPHEFQSNPNRFTHLFPLGSGTSGATSETNLYNGGEKFGENYVPPYDAYGYMRSSTWNTAYYDPDVDYTPWPTYGGYGWPNIEPTEAWLDPVLIGSTQVSRRIDLTSSIPADAFGTNESATFDRLTGMWCDNSGTLCTADSDFSGPYWAATYFVPDTDSDFTVDTTLTTTTTVVDSSDVIVLEAENATLGSGVSTELSSSASGGEAVLFNSGTSYNESFPGPDYGAEFNFSTSASTVEIWVRRKMFDGNTDSLWVSLDNHPDTSIIPDDTNSWYTDLLTGKKWYQWRDGHTEGYGDYVWEKWADVNLIDASNYTLNIRQRETGVGLDQIAIVQGAAPVFSTVGALSNSAPSSGTAQTYNCSTSSSQSIDFYQAFHDNRAWFTGVDAFAPDGSCLEKVEIRSSVADYPSGRTYADELQNFANWFTYYRKRHQVARGALGSSLQGIRGIRSGLYWANNRRTIDMYDLDVDADLQTLLGENYYRVSSGGTPNRESLNHAGSQFDTNTDIIQYSCQRNYTLMFTDGYTSQGGGFSSVGNSDGNRGEPYADNVSNTLADVADYYFNRSLRSGTTDIDGDVITEGSVPVPSACSDGTPDPWLDCNANLHMNTYMVSFGLAGQEVFGQTYDNGTISGVYDEVRDAYIDAPTWPSDIGFDGRAIDDLYHAAVNGRGEMYYAQRPQELKDQLQSALRDILATEGSSAGLTFNSATLNADSLVFNTIFNTTNWTGDLIATRLDPATGEPTGGIAWQAQSVLENQDWENRHVISYDPISGQSELFRWANLTSDQQADLSTSPNGTQDTLGEQRVNYLRGDRSNEGTTFRERQALLGDMVSSTPAYVANTSVAWPDHNENSLFGGGNAQESHSYFRRTTVRDRDPMIYVGANDGMLHGFDATNGTGGGTERLAYIPSAMFSDDIREGLHFLTDPDYTHRFYVDAEPAYSDVYVDWGGDIKWRTVLSGGFRTGAKGFYALDVTDPDEFSDANAADRVLFEYNNTADPDLGYMFERPSIGMLNNGEWALIYGNGYNSINGQGAIYVVFIERVLADGWVPGTTFLKFPTNVDGAINGITAIDYESNRVIDAVYASDAGGYMWKLDLSGANESTWGYDASSGGNPVPLFDTDDGAGNRQPIITRPRVITHRSVDDSTGNAPNRMVIFGTGSMVEEADLSDTSVQSFYTVWDDGSVSTTALNRSDLLESEVTATTYSNGAPKRDLGLISNQSPWGGQNKGFYFDMPLLGERVLDYVDIRESKQSPGEFYALFSSVIPDSDVCSYGGTSWIMAVDLKTGETPTYAVFDTDGNGVVDKNDEQGAGTFSDEYLVDFVGVGGLGYGNTSLGDILTFKIEDGQQSFTGRMGWQELIAR